MGSNNMYAALLYKEWIKIRWVLLIVSLVTCWTLTQLFLQVREFFEYMEPIAVWSDVVHRKAVFYSGIEYNAVIAGVGIALIQFIPETIKRRLRLLFHLPIQQNRALYFMMATGLACTLFVVALNVAGLLVIVAARFPSELIQSAIVTSAPWLFAGVVAYFATVLVVVEPLAWRRCAYAALSFGLVQLFFNGRGYETYAHSFWSYALLGGLFSLTIVLPAFRFKRGIN